MTAHVILQTAESLSVDAYSIEQVTDKRTTREDHHINNLAEFGAQIMSSIFGGPDNEQQKPYFITEKKWYEAFDQPGYEKESGITVAKSDEEIGKFPGSSVDTAIRNRFIGYIAGGDETKADRILKSVYIVDGLEGLDFSKSYVKNNTLHIELNYKLHYMISDKLLPPVSITQKCAAKLWR